MNLKFGLLEVRPNDKVLELGFGPGIGVRLLAQAASGGYVFGVDPSKEMLEQARARNARAIASGQVDLRLGSAETLPFRSESFDKAMAINSLQVGPGAIFGRRQLTSTDVNDTKDNVDGILQRPRRLKASRA